MKRREGTIISKAAPAVIQILVIMAIGLFGYLALSGTAAAQSAETATSGEPTYDPDETRRHVVDNAVSDTGALNMTTAIYLGYRAMDTIGETLVLLVAVAGSIALLERPR